MLLRSADAVLSDPDRVAACLEGLNAELRQRRACTSEHAFATLVEVLGKGEERMGFRKAVRVTDELAAPEFLAMLRRSEIPDDRGVSMLHGSQTHRIQFRLLALNMGADNAQELLVHMGGCPKNGPPWRAEPNSNGGKLTLWDDLMDAQGPIVYPNTEGAPVREVFSGKVAQHPVVDNELHFPVNDARSPEWLQFVMFCSPASSGDRLSAAVKEELDTRLDEVHTGVYGTGFEKCFGKVYCKAGFDMPT